MSLCGGTREDGVVSARVWVLPAEFGLHNPPAPFRNSHQLRCGERADAAGRPFTF
jgi:hypothetical protein